MFLPKIMKIARALGFSSAWIPHLGNQIADRLAKQGAMPPCACFSVYSSLSFLQFLVSPLYLSEGQPIYNTFRFFLMNLLFSMDLIIYIAVV